MVPQSAGSGPGRCPDPRCAMVLQEAGFCPGCREFTGLCAAGRRLLLTDREVTVPRMPHPRDYCREWQAIRVRVTMPGGTVDDGLCEAHYWQLAHLVAEGLARACLAAPEQAAGRHA